MERVLETLNVCVTGRRHIVPEALERVEFSARLFFRALFDAYSGPISFYSGGAIGSDTIAARLFLEERARRPERNASLVLAAPFPLERYYRDFSNVATNGSISELNEFKELVEKCDRVEIVSEERESDRTDYLAPYVRLGEFLCDRADVMLAFWNGDVSEVKRGGTVDVALTKLARKDGSILYCASTPELKRKKRADGTKAYFPEPTERAGEVAILRSSEDIPIAFCAAELGADRLRDMTIVPRNSARRNEL